MYSWEGGGTLLLSVLGVLDTSPQHGGFSCIVTRLPLPLNPVSQISQANATPIAAKFEAPNAPRTLTLIDES